MTKFVLGVSVPTKRRRFCVVLTAFEFSNLGGPRTMKKFTIAAAAAFAAVFAAGQASATVIDFVAESSGNERGVADGAQLNTAALGGLNLEFTAGIGAARRDFAYFNDAAADNGPGGLGTCTNLDTAGQCTPSYDDVIASNEWVQVGFVDAPFQVKKVSFLGENNVPLDASLGLLRITTSLNSMVTSVVMTFAQATTTNFKFVDWIRFEFVDTEFTVASISNIPVPGALPLLLSGLAGLGFAARRRKA